jgi:hypothetical protein
MQIAGRAALFCAEMKKSPNKVCLAQAGVGGGRVKGGENDGVCEMGELFWLASGIWNLGLLIGYGMFFM